MTYNLSNMSGDVLGILMSLVSSQWWCWNEASHDQWEQLMIAEANQHAWISRLARKPPELVYHHLRSDLAILCIFNDHRNYAMPGEVSSYVVPAIATSRVDRLDIPQ